MTDNSSLAGVACVTQEVDGARLFRIALEASPISTIMVTSDGMIALATRGAERMFGYARDELLGKSVECLVPASSRDRHVSLRSAFAGEPGALRMGRGRLLRGVRKDGSEFLVEVGLNPVDTVHGVITIVTIADITSEQETQLQRGFLAAIVESAESAIIATDLNGTVTSWNPAAERLFGHTAPEAIGQSVLLIVPSGCEGEVWENLEQVRAGNGVKPYDTRRRRKDGTAFPVALTVSPIRDSSGRIIGASKILRDVTDRQAAEEAIRRRTQELEHSNAELEQFAYVASHDLQEPLRMVSSFCDLLSEECGDNLSEAGREYIGFAVEGAHRMEQLIDDLLEYSLVGRQKNTRGTLSVDAAVENAIANLDLAVRESRAVIECEALPEIQGDFGRVSQLFQNLIGNSIKFSKDGPPKVRIGAKRMKSAWEFWVSDNGIGIPPDQKENIFRIFHRLHSREEHPGNGIGLAICKRIVENLGGRIWEESGPGAGATFRFIIPDIGGE